MSLGQGNVIFSNLASVQGPPFSLSSADNGLSVDPVTGRIVLGNAVGGSAGRLLSAREINLNGNNLTIGQGAPFNGQFILIADPIENTIDYSLGTGATAAGAFGNYFFGTNNFSIEFSDGIISGAIVFDSGEGDIRHDSLLRLRGITPGSFVNVECANGLRIIGSTIMLRTGTSWGDGAAANAGTLTNAPAAGDPTKWIPIDDNGTTRHIPSW